MFKRSLTVAKIAGVPVRIHWTFLLLLGWVFWTGYSSGGTASGLRMVVFVGAVFVCVVAHEFGHITAARAFGIQTRDVTLLPIGGVASLANMPEKPWQELIVAIAGPMVNVLIAGVLLPIAILSGGFQSADELLQPGHFIQTFAASLAAINIWLLLFNLLPAFPMDGGRVVRAVLAMMTDRVTATRAAAMVGKVLAVVMGIVGLIYGMPMLVILSFFVFTAAGAEAVAVQTRAALMQAPLGEMMTRDFRVLRKDDLLESAVEELLHNPQTEFVVTDDGTASGHVEGVLIREDMLRVMQMQNRGVMVGAVMRNGFQIARPSDSAMQALQSMQTGGCPVIPVVENGMLVGVVTVEQFRRAIMVKGSIWRHVKNTAQRAESRTHMNAAVPVVQDSAGLSADR
ncbi:MAG TPA: site-2 protease family protein [Phycisphaerales bacterium]|nr:site-2 protease family protein [Phycisphaerales bacterium]